MIDLINIWTMLSIEEIKKFYPPKLQGFKRSILREYLQYKILQTVSRTAYSHKMSFLGGTALRIVFNNNRFSEDLDFDNFSLDKDDFENISEAVRKGLELEGYEVEIRNVFKGAYRCYVKIPKILFDSGLSGYEDEKILIQLDTFSQGFNYQPEKKILNRFDVFEKINVTPLSIILSQKIFTIFNRKRMKGRDLYDVVFMLSQTKPDYDYLDQKVGIKDSESLRKELLATVKNVDMEGLVKDVRPFLFDPEDSKKITFFSDYINDAEL